MVGGQHDHRVGEPPGGLQMGEEPADLVVGLLHEAHVGRDHPLAHLVAGEGAADAVALERGIDGVRVAPLVLVTHGRQHVLGAVHGVVGGGHDVGPVGLDVAQVAEPRAGGGVGELDGAVREPGRLGVGLEHRGRVARVRHEPARGELVTLPPGVGEVGPGVGAGVTLLAQPLVVGGAGGVVEAVGPLGPEPIVAHPDVEAALRLAGADHRVGGEAEAGHPFGIGAHVGLADEPAAHAQGPQVIAQRHLAHPEWKPVPLRPVRGDVAPGVEAHPRRAADRRLDVRLSEAHAARSQGVDVGRLEVRVAGAAQVVVPELVEHDEEDVHGASVAVLT